MTTLRDLEATFVYYYSSIPEPIVRERIYAVRTVLDFFRIMEDYILLKRKDWNVDAMKQELEEFEKRITS